MRFRSTAVCTATIEPGVITQRVVSVDDASSEAIAMMEVAERNRQRAHRRRVRKNTAKDEGRGFVVFSVSMYLQDIADIDEAVEDLKLAGRTDMTRSKLIRIAFRRLDVAALGREKRVD